MISRVLRRGSKTNTAEPRDRGSLVLRIALACVAGVTIAGCPPVVGREFPAVCPPAADGAVTAHVCNGECANVSVTGGPCDLDPCAPAGPVPMTCDPSESCTGLFLPGFQGVCAPASETCNPDV